MVQMQPGDYKYSTEVKKTQKENNLATPPAIFTGINVTYVMEVLKKYKFFHNRIKVPENTTEILEKQLTVALKP